MTRILRVTLCLAAVLLAAAPVAAEDFTITIPLQFSNLLLTVDGFLGGLLDLHQRAAAGRPTASVPTTPRA